jgi:hypothetical protein
LPLRTGMFSKLSRVTLGVGYVLICFTPLIIAGHYRLFSRGGRAIYEESGSDYPWLTRQEGLLALLAAIAAVVAGFAIASG